MVCSDGYVVDEVAIDVSVLCLIVARRTESLEPDGVHANIVVVINNVVGDDKVLHVAIKGSRLAFPGQASRNRVAADGQAERSRADTENADTVSVAPLPCRLLNVLNRVVKYVDPGSAAHHQDSRHEESNEP